VTAEVSRDKGPASGPQAPHAVHRLPTAFDDPLPALPETAQRLLLAAKHIIATHGFDALTLNAVSTASGENKAMISYYFGNKAGLVAAVLDCVIHDDYVASQNRMQNIAPEDRCRQLVEEMRRMTGSAKEFRVFFEMLPHVVRDEVLRRRMVSLYRWYWSVKLEWLGVTSPTSALEDPELLGLTQLLSAVIDGLAVQAAIDPAVDLANPFRVFHEMLTTFVLERRCAEIGPAAGNGRPHPGVA